MWIPRVIFPGWSSCSRLWDLARYNTVPTGTAQDTTEQQDFHASQLFKARQGKDKKVANWIHKIRTLESQFHEPALLNCSVGVQEGISYLSDHLCNISFIQELASDRIQTIVWSRNYKNINEIAETALVEEHYSMQAREIPGRRSVRV